MHSPAMVESLTLYSHISNCRSIGLPEIHIHAKSTANTLVAASRNLSTVLSN